MNNLFTKVYSSAKNTFDCIGIKWDYAIIGIGMQNDGGRINRYIITNHTENFLVYNYSSNNITTLNIRFYNNVLSIIKDTSFPAEFYFYSIQFLQVV